MNHDGTISRLQQSLQITRAGGHVRLPTAPNFVKPETENYCRMNVHIRVIHTSDVFPWPPVGAVVSCPPFFLHRHWTDLLGQVQGALHRPKRRQLLAPFLLRSPIGAAREWSTTEHNKTRQNTGKRGPKEVSKRHRPSRRLLLCFFFDPAKKRRKKKCGVVRRDAQQHMFNCSGAAKSADKNYVQHAEMYGR